MRHAAAALLLLAVLCCVPVPASAQEPSADADRVYSDPTGFLWLTLPEGWERWSPEATAGMFENLPPWPRSTAIFSLALDPDRYRCPCAWVARLESGPEKVYLDAVERRLYPEAPLERIAGPRRLASFSARQERYFQDVGRGVLWGWQDTQADDGRELRAAIVYVPTQTATAVLLFQAEPELFDRHVGELVKLIDGLEVQPRTRPGRVRASEPTAVVTPDAPELPLEAPGMPPVVRPLGALLLLALLFAGIYGACENGPVFALKCMLLVVISGSVFLGNFVVAVRESPALAPPVVPHDPALALGRGLLAAIALPLLCAALAAWRWGRGTRLSNAWLLGSLLAVAGSLLLIWRTMLPSV